MSGLGYARLRWLSEPLVVFLLLGGALVAIDRARTQQAVAADPPEIRVSAATVDSLRSAWRERHARAPSAEELQAAVDEHVRREVLVREALAAGLHRDDLIVRRRLHQKMEFALKELAVAAAPDPDAVRAWIEERPEHYRSPARVSFHHVFFSRDRRGEALAADARAASERLSAADARPAAPWKLGDPFLRERVVRGRTAAEIDRVFGGELAAAVMRAEVGRWSGPFPSAFGLHLVWVDARHASDDAVGGEAWARALADLRAARRDAAYRDELERRVARYDVVVEETR